MTDDEKIAIEEMNFWDALEEVDDGMPRKYVTLKEQPVYLREGDFE